MDSGMQGTSREDWKPQVVLQDERLSEYSLVPLLTHYPQKAVRGECRLMAKNVKGGAGSFSSATSAVS